MISRFVSSRLAFQSLLTAAEAGTEPGHSSGSLGPDSTITAIFVRCFA